MHLAFSSMNTLKDPAPSELARALEDRGFESLWYGEHSHIPCAQKTPYPPGGEMRGVIYSWVLRLGPLEIRRWGWGGNPYDPGNSASWR